MKNDVDLMGDIWTSVQQVIELKREVAAHDPGAKGKE